jgi:hypothetical protein
MWRIDEHHADELTANGLPISRRERWESFQKTNDLARAAVGCIPPSRRA